MIKKKKIILFFCLTTSLIFVAYAVFHNSDDWRENENTKVEVYDKDYPFLNTRERIIETLKRVEYAAIVYPTAEHVYPNSWFHRKILSNPYESTTYTVKADVEYTILGEKHSSISYASAGNALVNHALFVALCISDSNQYYAPDNGYEFPATKEAIEFVKSIDMKEIVEEGTSVCSGQHVEVESLTKSSSGR